MSPGSAVKAKRAAWSAAEETVTLASGGSCAEGINPDESNEATPLATPFVLRRI